MSVKLSNLIVISDRQVILNLSKGQHEAYRLYTLMRAKATIKKQNYSDLNWLADIHLPYYKSSNRSNLIQKFRKTIKSNPLFFYTPTSNRIYFKSIAKVYHDLNITGPVKGDFYQAQPKLKLFRRHILFQTIAGANYLKTTSPELYGRSIPTIAATVT